MKAHIHKTKLMEHNIAISRWNAIPCDVQKVKLDDLKVSSGLQFHKSFLQAILMSYLPFWTRLGSEFPTPVSLPWQHPGQFQGQEQCRWLGRGSCLASHMCEEQHNAVVHGAWLSGFLFVSGAGLWDFSVLASLSYYKKCICQRIWFPKLILRKACELVPTSVGPHMHLSQWHCSSSMLNGPQVPVEPLWNNTLKTGILGRRMLCLKAVCLIRKMIWLFHSSGSYSLLQGLCAVENMLFFFILPSSPIYYHFCVELIDLLRDSISVVITTKTDVHQVC